MQSDIRQSDAFRAVERFYSAMFAPGEGHVHAAGECIPAGDGRHAYLTGLSFSASLLEGPTAGIYRLDLTSGDLTAVFAEAARLLRPAPDAGCLACVMQPPGSTDERLCLASPGGDLISSHAIDGYVEQLEWAPDGTRLLLVVAGAGSDLPGYLGGFARKPAAGGPAWLPDVQTGAEDFRWRRLWIFDVATGALRVVSRPGTNVWEATWHGPDFLAAVCSDDHGEGSWYTASLRRIALADGGERVLHVPTDQIGLPTGSPDGRHLAFVEATCSDRGIVCGTLRVIGADGRIRTLATNGVEITAISWRDDQTLHYAGQQAFETVVGDCDVDTNQARELWRSSALTCGLWYPAARPLPGGASLMVTEAYARAPCVTVVDARGLHEIRSLAAPGAAAAMAECGSVTPAVWNAPDGLEIHGWLACPRETKGPVPLVLDIHGGPIWAHRNRWMARGRATPLLVQRGCAVLHVNPRGSSTRGQDFARLVKGDMGGADTLDFIAAIDHFVDQGLADPARLACTGASYGGFMSAWLVTQEPRFAAAAPISPVTDWFSQHRTSQIPHFDLAFLDGSASRPDGKFFSRSPAMFADRVRTPCLVMAGAIDKNTPPTQALEFHQSLLEAGTQSVLAVYPEDGHSLRGYPAYIDSAARILAWFGSHLALGKASR